MRTSKRNSALRRLRFEKHEERCMLTTMADVVFLVDESGTDTNTNTQAWLATIIDELDASFSAESVNVQYGLVGFGEGLTSNPRMAHSHLLGPVGSNGLWTNDYNHVVAAINNNLESNGQQDIEDGWDSIEHAIAEYDIREGSAPIFILVQGDEGKEFVNETLTHDGIRRALDSKNAILNSVVAGALLYDGEPPTGSVDEPIDPPQGVDISWAPIFDLTAYETTPGDFSDIYVLGVESDAADDVHDRQHDFVSFNTVTHTTPTTLPTTTSDALQVSFNGSGTGGTGLVGSGKSVVISEALAGGIGGVPSDANDYRAKHATFDVVDMSGSLEVTPGGSVAYSFDFFGSSYTQVFVNQDGTIELGSSSLSFDPNNVDLSTLAPGATDDRPSTPTIAVLWDDLEDASSGNLQGKILHKTSDFDGDGTNDLAIQWTDYRYAEDNGDHDPLSFQAVLYGDGTIRFNYEDIGGFADNSSERIDDNTEGINATVGIWSGAADPITLAEGKFVPGPHTVFGEEFVASTGAPGGAGEMPDNYARMAWDTGGAAWDVGLVQRFGSTSPEANALRDALVDSLVNQINRPDAAVQVFESDTPILELNIGGPQLGDYGAHDEAEPLYAWPSEVVTAPGGTMIDDTSNSIPSNANTDIFKTGRTASSQDVLQIQSESGVSTGASGFVASGSSVLISTDATAGFTESSVYNADQLATAEFEDISVSPTATQVTTLDSGDFLDGFFRLDDMEFGDFEFLFYGEDRDALFVSTHGLITFDSGDTSFNNADWTVTPPAQPSIAVLWDDAAPNDVSDNTVGQIYWERIGRGTDDDRLIIQWENAVYADDVAPYDEITYQALLYSDGRIQFNYQDLDSVGSAQTGGVSATAGVASPIDDLRFSFDTTTVPGGEYIVELFFSEVDANVTFEGQRVFDVVIEGETVLNDYDIMADHAKIDDAFSSIEHDSVAAGKNTGVVKRFFVNVSGDDGLQIDLLAENGLPLLNGLRILAFAPIVPGDYNRDGAVDALDYAVWRDSLGDSVARFSGADGSGNGAIDTDDYQLWKSAFGNSTGLLLGDFNLNGSVDSHDYDVWYATNGNIVQPGTGADANGDGIVDTLDYDIWRDLFGSTMSVAHFGLLNTTAQHLSPKVVGFALSNQTGGNYDFATRTGSGEQLRSVDLTSANKVSITFSEHITEMPFNALQLVNLDGTAPAISSYSYDTPSYTATWTLNQPLSDGRYLVTLKDGVEGAGGVLDGELFNPWTLGDLTSTAFPSGDGIEGGEFRFRFTVLAGDTDHNNIDGSTDYTEWPTAEPGMILVSTLADESDSDTSVGDTSLREALSLAATQAGKDTIVFWNTLHASSAATILLGDADGSGAINGGETPVQLTIDSDLKIIGPGAELLTLSGGDAARVIKATSGNTVTIAGVTIADGQSVGDGGGIYSEADLTLDYVTLRDNQAGSTGLPKWGGAVHAQSSDLTIHASTISDNGGYHGGGVAFRNQSGVNALRVERSTFNGNYSSGTGRGGGLYIYDFTATPSVSTIVNSTFSDNEANIAGSIGTNGTPIVNIYSSTITDNYSRQLVGGAHNNDNVTSGADITLHFSIIAGNTAAGATASWDLDGPINSASSYNLIGYENNTGLTHGVNGNMIVGGANIGLTALGDHGGPTETHALLDGSMAIAAGDAAFAASLGIEIDQRGIERDGGLFIDLGAFQLGADEYYGTI